MTMFIDADVACAVANLCPLTYTSSKFGNLFCTFGYFDPITACVTAWFHDLMLKCFCSFLCRFGVQDHSSW